MAEREQAFSLRNGNYKAVENCWYSHIVVNGATGVMKEPSGGTYEAKISVGDFGEADPQVSKAAGQDHYNVKIVVNFGQEVKELGVVSKNGDTIVTKGMMGIGKLKWATDEEIAAMEEEGDSIEAPTCPYELKPGKLGKLLWITGRPGLGKSTTAQLLSRHHGYVYYEADCFGQCRNPYIPPDAEDPTMATISQKPLKGEGLSERREICNKIVEVFKDLMEGREPNKKNLEVFYEAQCADILKERKRVGGDWAIAAVTLTYDMRNLIRKRLGPDLKFVMLSMDEADVRQRLKERHHGEEAALDMMAPINEICDPIKPNEENVIDVTVTPDMTREDVATKVLELVNL